MKMYAARKKTLLTPTSFYFSKNLIIQTESYKVWEQSRSPFPLRNPLRSLKTWCWSWWMDEQLHSPGGCSEKEELGRHYSCTSGISSAGRRWVILPISLPHCSLPYSWDCCFNCCFIVAVVHLGPKASSIYVEQVSEAREKPSHKRPCFTSKNWKPLSWSLLNFSEHCFTHCCVG